MFEVVVWVFQVVILLFFYRIQGVLDLRAP